METTDVLLALGATLGFALGSQGFTHYSRKISPEWMNCFKSLAALLMFGLAILAVCLWQQVGILQLIKSITGYQYTLILISGFIGLGYGDVLLLKAFKEMGPGRTMLLFAFQPLIVGYMAYLAFDQKVNTQKLYAIIFFLICVFIFAYENKSKNGHWGMASILTALGGTSLDSIATILNRTAYNSNPGINGMHISFLRCFGALIFFLIYTRFRPIHFLTHYKGQPKKDKTIIIGSCFIGTFFALWCYMQAQKNANLATLSSMAITGVIFSAVFECIIEKKWPSKFLITAFAFFFVGMYFVLNN